MHIITAVSRIILVGPVELGTGSYMAWPIGHEHSKWKSVFYVLWDRKNTFFYLLPISEKSLKQGTGEF